MAEAETPADPPDAAPSVPDRPPVAAGSHPVAKKAGVAGAGLATLWLLGILFRRRRR